MLHLIVRAYELRRWETYDALCAVAAQCRLLTFDEFVEVGYLDAARWILTR